MTPQQPLTVTLEAQQWNQLLDILYNVAAPYRITHPLITTIQQQLVAERPDNVAQFNTGC